MSYKLTIPTLACVLSLLQFGCIGSEPSHGSEKNLLGAKEAVITALVRIENTCRGKPMGLLRFSTADRNPPPTGDTQLVCEGITRPVIQAIEDNTILVQEYTPKGPEQAAFAFPRNNWAIENQAAIRVPTGFLDHKYNDAILLHEAVHAHQWLVDREKFETSQIEHVEGDALLVQGHYYALLGDLSSIPSDQRPVVNDLRDLENEPSTVLATTEKIYGDAQAVNALRRVVYELTTKLGPDPEEKRAKQALNGALSILRLEAQRFLGIQPVSNANPTQQQRNIYNAWRRNSRMVLGVVTKLEPASAFLLEMRLYEKNDIKAKLKDASSLGSVDTATLYALHLATLLR